ncbi:MAG TPA: type II secretion system F family protein [Candidatus Bathyarchaeia archaeon]|nr:type II secretion system F family protein [Candidatus Bathyarchaeia archaeon]
MKTDWYAILHSSLGDLARGKTSEFLQPRIFVRGKRHKRPLRAPRMLKRMRAFYVISLLARLVKVNAPLAQGLAATSPSAPSWGLSKTLYVLSRDLEKGLSLDDAMRRQPSVFPSLYADLVQAGQKSGSLEQTLNRIMDDMTDKRSVAREIKGFLLYFAAMLFGFVFFSAFLHTKVMPVFYEMNHELEVPGDYAPWNVYQVAAAVGAYWAWYTAGAAILAVVVLLLILPSRFGHRFRLPRSLQRLASQIGLRVPLVGRLVKSANIATSTQMLAQLVEAGVPLDDALDDVAAASITPAFSKAFRRMRNKIRQGAQFSKALESESPLFPKSFSVAAANAEYHGDLAGALKNLAAFYRTKAFRQLKMVKPMLMPFLILILGGLVFTQYFGIFAGAINISEMIMGGM